VRGKWTRNGGNGTSVRKERSLGTEGTEPPDEPPSTSGKPSSIRGNTGRGSDEVSKALQRGAFALQRSRARLWREPTEPPSESPEPPSEVSRASTLATLDDTRASVDLQLSWLKIKGNVSQLRAKEESFAPKRGRMDRMFHEHLPKARPDRGMSGGDLPKLSGASEEAFASSGQGELHCRDFSRSSCPTSRASKPIDLGSAACAWEVIRSWPRFATSCLPWPEPGRQLLTMRAKLAWPGFGPAAGRTATCSRSPAPPPP
jgi:hypothetical protein